KGEFRTCSLKVEEPAGMALPTCETPQDPGFWLVGPESSCFPSKCLTNALENSLHCINEGRGFCQDFRHGKIHRLPLLRAFALADIVVRFQNIRAVSLGIAVQRPTREHGQAFAVAPRVNDFALPIVIANQLLVDSWQRLREFRLQQMLDYRAQ